MTKTVEFETELTGSRTLSIPPEIAAALPSKGKATIVVFVETDIPMTPHGDRGRMSSFCVMIQRKTQSMTSTVEFGEVYICAFPFTSGSDEDQAYAGFNGYLFRLPCLQNYLCSTS